MRFRKPGKKSVLVVVIITMLGFWYLSPPWVDSSKVYPGLANLAKPYESVVTAQLMDDGSVSFEITGPIVS